MKKITLGLLFAIASFCVNAQEILIHNATGSRLVFSLSYVDSDSRVLQTNPISVFGNHYKYVENGDQINMTYGWFGDSVAISGTGAYWLSADIDGNISSYSNPYISYGTGFISWVVNTDGSVYIEISE